jgi:competence protein ComEC
MKIWTRFPFVRLLLPLIAGILFFRVIPLPSGMQVWPLILGFLGLLVILFLLLNRQSFRFRWLFGLVLNAFLILLGFLLSLAGNQLDFSSHFSKFNQESRIVYSAYITDPPGERENSYKFTIQVNRVSVNGKFYPAKGRIIAYAQKDSLVASLDYGTEILFSEMPQKVKAPANPGEFDYARYLSIKNVFHQVYLGKANFMLTGRQKGNFVKALALKARNRLLETLQHYEITGREYAVIAALLIGYDDLLDATQRKEYSGAGVVHILCVSGLHVGVIFLLADNLFFFLRKRKKALWLRPLLIILVIWGFAMITGLAPSVMRASLMFSLITIGKSMKRKSHTYNTLAASAFILLLFNPGMLYDLGFQLSYAAVAGIVTFQPLIRQIYIPGNKIVEYIWDLTCVSLAAQLATAPISIYYFHQFPSYFLLANLIAIPLAGMLIYTGVVFVFLSFIPLFGKITAIILIYQIKFLNASVSFIENLPGAVSHNLYLTPQATLAFYFLLFIVLMWYLQKNKNWIYPAMAVCLLLAADFANTAIRRMNNKVFIVQSINKHSVLSFTHGRTQTIVADSAVISKPALLNYSTDAFRIKSGIREIVYAGFSGVPSERSSVPSNLNIKSGFFGFLDKKGIVISPELKLLPDDKQIAVDYVILTNNARHKLDKLSWNFPGAIFIADASNARRKLATWAEEAAELGVPFYSVQESGAFVVKIE